MHEKKTKSIDVTVRIHGKLHVFFFIYICYNDFSKPRFYYSASSQLLSKGIYLDSKCKFFISLVRNTKTTFFASQAL